MASELSRLPRPHRTRLREQLVVHLAYEIVSGHLAPGQALRSEPELAREFGISKVVMRECIQELASYGMIRVQHGKRTVVLDRDDWNVLATPVQEAYGLAGATQQLTKQLYDVRIVLEMSAAAWAAENALNSHLDELDDLLDQMWAIAQHSRDVSSYLSADRAFHDVIGRATGNMVLRGIMRDLHTFVIANWTASRITSDQLKLLTEHHARIAAAIRAKDPSAARQAMEDHVTWAKDIEAGPVDTHLVRLTPLAGGHTGDSTKVGGSRSTVQ